MEAKQRVTPANQTFMSCENSTSTVFFCHKHFSREPIQAREVLTPAELSLEQYNQYFTSVSYRLYLPEVILPLTRNLTPHLSLRAKASSQNRTLLDFLYVLEEWHHLYSKRHSPTSHNIYFNNRRGKKGTRNKGVFQQQQETKNQTNQPKTIKTTVLVFLSQRH